MSNNRLRLGFTVLALVGFAACGGEDEEAPDAVLMDTVTQPGTATVQVPVTDTAIIQREISIDTTVRTDTTVREGQPRDTIRRP